MKKSAILDSQVNALLSIEMFHTNDGSFELLILFLVHVGAENRMPSSSDIAQSKEMTLASGQPKVTRL